MTTTQTTATSALPFSPLTLKGLEEARNLAAINAANSLTYHTRYSSTLLEDAEEALPFAVRYCELLDAAVFRCDAEREAQR